MNQTDSIFDNFIQQDHGKHEKTGFLQFLHSTWMIGKCCASVAKAQNRRPACHSIHPSRSETMTVIMLATQKLATFHF